MLLHTTGDSEILMTLEQGDRFRMREKRLNEQTNVKVTQEGLVTPSETINLSVLLEYLQDADLGLIHSRYCTVCLQLTFCSKLLMLLLQVITLDR